MELGRPQQSQWGERRNKSKECCWRYCYKWGRLGGGVSRTSCGIVAALGTGVGLGRPGGVVGASWGALWPSGEHLKPVLNRTGSKEPHPRRWSQVGALGESWRKAVLEARDRILDRGRSFEPCERMRSHCEEPKKPVFRRPPTRNRHLRALGESWHKAALEARGRILDRGRSFEPCVK